MQSMARIMKFGASAIAMAAGAASAAALPTSGLIARLETDNVSAASGTQVAQWADQSGRGNSGNASGALQPTYLANATPTGRGAFDFDGHFFDIKAGANDQADFNKQQFTWYLVFAPDAPNVAIDNGGGTNPNFRGAPINTAYADMDPTATTLAGTTAWSSVVGTTTSASTTASFRGTGRNAENTFTSANAATSPGVTADQFYVGGSTWNAATGALSTRIVFADGTPYAASATGVAPFADPQGHTTTRIGGSGTNAATVSTPYDGRIAAVLIWNRVLTAGELADVETYLRDNYVVAVPEPTTLAAALGAAAVLVRRRRRAS